MTCPLARMPGLPLPCLGRDRGCVAAGQRGPLGSWLRGVFLGRCSGPQALNWNFAVAGLQGLQEWGSFLPF